MNTVVKGKTGEEIAKKYLQKNKYKIIEQNYYSRWGEIDLIVYDKKEKEFVFIEVKARGNKKYGNPEDAIDERKMEKIFKTAQTYLLKNENIDKYRFDCVAINFENNLDIKHYKNIS